MARDGQEIVLAAQEDTHGLTVAEIVRAVACHSLPIGSARLPHSLVYQLVEQCAEMYLLMN